MKGFKFPASFILENEGFLSHKWAEIFWGFKESYSPKQRSNLSKNNQFLPCYKYPFFIYEIEPLHLVRVTKILSKI